MDPLTVLLLMDADQGELLAINGAETLLQSAEGMELDLSTAQSMSIVQGPIPRSTASGGVEDTAGFLDGEENRFIGYILRDGNTTAVRIEKNPRPGGLNDGYMDFVAPIDPYTGQPRKLTDGGYKQEGSAIVIHCSCYELPPNSPTRNHYIVRGRWEGAAVPLPEGGGGGGGEPGEWRPIPITGEQRFSDVGPNDTGFADINSANLMGIIGGYSDGTFRPNANLTRMQAVVMIMRAVRWLRG